LNSWKVTRYPR